MTTEKIQSETSVLYKTGGGVATITLNRPDAANALDLPLVHALHDAVRRAAADDDVRVVVLAGAGERFCGGGDLGAMAAASDARAFIADLAAALHGVVRDLDGLGKPVVAAVQGSAAGAGLSLVLVADIVVATESTKLVTAYTSVGLTPDGGMSWLLPRVVGQRRASQLILTSEPLTAAAALDLGIVSTVCPAPDLPATAQQFARDLAARPAHAVGAARQLIRSSWSRTLSEHLDLEADTIATASGTAETAARISKFARRS